MTLKPGSTFWLMRHELRLSWRGLTRGRAGGGGRFRRLWLLLFLPILLLATAGLPLGFAFRHVQVPIVPIAVVAAAAVTLGIFTLMLSQTLAAAVAALYERADLDLLFSSPLEPRRVLTVRFLAVAVNVFALFGIVTTPIILPSVVMGHPGWIALELVLFAIALGATGAGLLIAAALFHAIGPRRTRTIGQVLAAITGAAFFIAAQAPNILGRGRSATLWQRLALVAQDQRFHAAPGLDWPLRAALGQPLPLLGFVAAGAGLFLIANQVLGARFAADAAAAAGAGAPTRRVRAGRLSRFSAGAFQATVRKELRLLARDPALISQVLLRLLYMIPLGAALLRSAGRGDLPLLPGTVAALGFMAGQVSASLAWITISAEDSPDLLSVSPTPVSILRRAKIAAAVGPVVAIIAPILIALAVMASPWIALVGAAGAAAQMAMGAYMNVWWQRPGKRADFRRRRQASWFVSLAEFFLGLLIAAATALFAFGTVWGVVPALVAGVAIGMLRRSDEQIARALRAAA